MQPDETVSRGSESSRKDTLSDAEVLEKLAQAEAAYEAYLTQAELARYRAPPDVPYEPKYDWATPMTLVTY